MYLTRWTGRHFVRSNVALLLCLGVGCLLQSCPAAPGSCCLTWTTLNMCQTIRFPHILRLDTVTYQEHPQLRATVESMCKPKAEWGCEIHSQLTAIIARGSTLRTKQSKMPTPDRALACIVRFASALDMTIAELHLQIVRNCQPGIISGSLSPDRALVAFAVALRQMCFAYNLVAPHELPTKVLQHSDRSPLPNSSFTAPFDMTLGHDAYRGLLQSELLSVPSLLLALTMPTTAAIPLPPNVVVETGIVWEHPTHAPRVLELIRRATASLTSPNARLAVVLGGNECPFGFVRAMLAHGRGALRVDLPEHMDCSSRAPPISVPAGVWCPCPVEVFAFNNQFAIRNVRLTDHVLIINALQVLPCVLEHFVMPGTVASCFLALGCRPPVGCRFAPISPLTVTLMDIANAPLLKARAASVDKSSTVQEIKACIEDHAILPPKHLSPELRRTSQAKGIPTLASALESLPGTLFTRSASRLDTAAFTLPTPMSVSLRVVPTPGRLASARTVADLTFLPRVAHLCIRNPEHQCNTVLLDANMAADAIDWIDTAWSCPSTVSTQVTNTIQCVFTQIPLASTIADQSMHGPTYQRPWMQCFVESLQPAKSHLQPVP